MTESNTSFRDRPINLDEKGRRKWVYAKKPSGKWYRRRTIFSIVALAIFFAIPFIKVNGYPLVLLDISSRKFILFGAIFWAQDTFIFALLMLSFLLFIILFTVTFGRLWCGWACPQTILLEMVYRKIEFLIEGDRIQRIKLDQSPWTTEKMTKKGLKHFIFILIALIFSNVFILYFIGTQGWLDLFKEPFVNNISIFGFIIGLALFIYWLYSYFREQFCTMVCPYGRMQGVLLDSKSIVVAYDYVRGEPRGPKSDGDCIDCKRCMAVCPTGIDIRNGTQLECVNCTACIDECNQVMRKINKPEGLIRYDSEKGIKKNDRRIWYPRNIAYSGVLLLLFSFFIYTLLTRPIIETNILRTPGLVYQEYDDNTVSNLYNIKVVNKTHDDLPLNLKLLSHEGRIDLAGGKMILKDQGIYESAFLLFISKDELTSTHTKITFGIYSGDNLIEEFTTTFVSP